MLILASTSRYRHALLTRVGIPFTVASSNYDERQHDHLFSGSPTKCAREIAGGKATSVLQGLAPESEDWVLSADQIVWMQTPSGPVQFHKAGTGPEALRQLMQMRGQTIYSTTGLALLSKREYVDCITTTEELDVRTFSETEARAYVEKYTPIDCAGSFRMEDPGITLFSEIRGDWTGCQGFPLITVTKLLRLVGLLPT